MDDPDAPAGRVGTEPHSPEAAMAMDSGILIERFGTQPTSLTDSPVRLKSQFGKGGDLNLLLHPQELLQQQMLLRRTPAH